MIGEILRSKVVRALIAASPRGGARASRLISKHYPSRQVFDLVGALSDVSMHLDTSDAFQAEMAYGSYQPDLLGRLVRLVRPGDVVLTAGAHLGYIVLALAKAVGPNGKVLAFEADPRMVQECAKNLALAAGSSAEKLLQKLTELGWELDTLNGSVVQDGGDIVCTAPNA